MTHLIDVLLHLDAYLNVVIQQYGVWTYLLLFVVVFLETGVVVTPFLPSDSLLFAAGAFAAAGALEVGWVFGLLCVTAVLGDTVNYRIGYMIGPRAFHGQSRFFKREHLDRTHQFYVYTCTQPWADGTTGMTLSPLAYLEKLAAIVPLPRVHLVRYADCLAPHRQRRGAIIPTPRQQGVDEEDMDPGTPRWSWARLLERVFDLAMDPCLLCRRGSRRITAAMTQEAVITRRLRHLQLASIPPPNAPARARQATCDWVASAHAVTRGLVGDVRATEVYLVREPHLGTFDIHFAIFPPLSQRRAMPCAGALRRCCDAALGARNRRRQGALGECRRGEGTKGRLYFLSVLPLSLVLFPARSSSSATGTAFRHETRVDPRCRDWA